MSDIAIKVLTLGSAALAATVARKALTSGWTSVTGKEPPANPESDDTSVMEAIAWAALSGALIGIARMIATRQSQKVAARFAPADKREEVLEEPI